MRKPCYAREMLTLAIALLAATPAESALERLSDFKGTWSCTGKTFPAGRSMKSA
jgi:hypothetical protein